MEILNTLPMWSLAALIFTLRVIDVSLGTMRTLAVVQGKVPLAVSLGFVEIFVWITAISSVITNVANHSFLPVAYAGGFAAGNAAGILLERRLAIGSTAIRIVSARGRDIAAALEAHSHLVTTIDGAAPSGRVQLLYATCPRRILPALVERARAIDPELFYVVERFAETSRLTPVPPPTGWRAVLKKK